MRKVKLDPYVQKFLAQLPGPWSARSPDAVMVEAWSDFCKHDRGKIATRLEFALALYDLDVDVVSTGVGGWVLAKI